MSTWVIVSWVLVAILTAINIIVFIKLKGASEQMMKMIFPDAKNMGEAMSRMQGMMQGMGGMGGMGAMGGRGGKRSGGPFMPGPGGRGPGGQNMDAQLKQAMEMLKRMQQPK